MASIMGYPIAVEASEREAAEASGRCFHCGLTLTAAPLVLTHGKNSYAVCCLGCEAAAKMIFQAGLDNYYRIYTPSGKAIALLDPEQEANLLAYDVPEVQAAFVKLLPCGDREASLLIEGMVCPACAWLIEQRLQRLPGVRLALVDYGARRACLRWAPQNQRLSRLLTELAGLGYAARPYRASLARVAATAEQHDLLKAFGVAVAMGMQVMMLALAVYTVDAGDVEQHHRDLINGLNLILTLPVVLYSGRRFYRSAWQDVRRWRVGMDVPVTIGIGLAFAGSVKATLDHAASTYYDSVCMFVTLLLAARYLEAVVRLRTNAAVDRLQSLEPDFAWRLDASHHGREPVRVTAAQLSVGDHVLIKPGERVPADSHVIEGMSTVDESLLTGEGRPLSKKPGDELTGGSLNIESALIVRVDRRTDAGVLSRIQDMVHTAQAQRPELTSVPDRLAPWLTAGVLLVAALTTWYGIMTDNKAWFENTLAVLVITCPCAVSLAAPAAVTAAIGRLIQGGVLVRSAKALERYARINQIAFDKTGTLTTGRMTIAATVVLRELSADQCLDLAAALEHYSEHPIAYAFRADSPGRNPLRVDCVETAPGAGLSGVIAGKRYRIGSPRYINQTRADDATALKVHDRMVAERTRQTVVILADEDGPLASFELADKLRAGALEAVAACRQRGLGVSLLTGDRRSAAMTVAATLGVADVHSELLPAEKLQCLQQMRLRGCRVAMVGDGVNDTPVLAGADVSISMAEAADLARANADFVLLGDGLRGVVFAHAVAVQCVAVMRQNLAWALVYNLAALPAAASGWLTPGLAAFGMSVSSLLVVVNALRLHSYQPQAM